MDRVSAPHVLDRPIARWCAAGLFLLSGAALAYIHREDLFGEGGAGAVAGNDPLAVCMQTRRAEIVKMEEEGLLRSDQVERALGQLEPVCRAQLKMEPASGPPPPGLLPQ
jgi:hypothetical protein